jgi:hypothetical protein
LYVMYICLIDYDLGFDVAYSTSFVTLNGL